MSFRSKKEFLGFSSIINQFKFLCTLAYSHQLFYELRFSLTRWKKIRELGIDKVLVVCDADNIGSARTITKNGGFEDVCFTEKDGNVVRRFWIDFKE
jgi:hypothetical protein